MCANLQMCVWMVGRPWNVNSNSAPPFKCRFEWGAPLKYEFEWWATLTICMLIVGHPTNVRLNGGPHLKCRFEWWPFKFAFQL
jgi:hypothetical protein